MRAVAFCTLCTWRRETVHFAQCHFLPGWRPETSHMHHKKAGCPSQTKHVFAMR